MSKLHIVCRPPCCCLDKISRPTLVAQKIRCSLKTSMLDHNAVAAAVSHKHYLIICVGAGLIQCVYKSHSKRGYGAHPLQKSISTIFFAGFEELWL